MKTWRGLRHQLPRPLTPSPNLPLETSRWYLNGQLALEEGIGKTQPSFKLFSYNTCNRSTVMEELRQTTIIRLPSHSSRNHPSSVPRGCRTQERKFHCGQSHLRRHLQWTFWHFCTSNLHFLKLRRHKGKFHRVDAANAAGGIYPTTRSESFLSLHSPQIRTYQK